MKPTQRYRNTNRSAETNVVPDVAADQRKAITAGRGVLQLPMRINERDLVQTNDVVSGTIRR